MYLVLSRYQGRTKEVLNMYNKKSKRATRRKRRSIASGGKKIERKKKVSLGRCERTKGDSASNLRQS